MRIDFSVISIGLKTWFLKEIMVIKKSYAPCKKFLVKMIISLACLSVLSLTSFHGAIKKGWAITERNPPSSWFINMNLFSRSAHSNLTCEVCHGTMKEDDKTHPDPKDPDFLRLEAKRIYDYSHCKTCHLQSYDRYLLGEHAKALKKEKESPNMKEGVKSEKRNAPTCGDCHSAHYEKSHLSKVKIGRKMTEICGSCHRAQKVTYLEDYHGKTAVHLGHEASAYCTDCHGAHNCISLKEKKTALLICQRCHPKAQERFAEFVIHPTIENGAKETKDNIEKRKKVAVIKTVSVIMFCLVVLIVSFFYGHSLLWLLRELHEKLRKH